MYLCITAQLIIACSSDSWKAYKKRGRNFNQFKIRFRSTQHGPTLVACVVAVLHLLAHIVAVLNSAHVKLTEVSFLKH